MNESLIEHVPSDELAYVYGIYAQACRILRKHQESIDLAEQAKTILKSQFERVLHSYLLATAYMSLTFISIAEDNLDNATFYLGMVRLFLTINTGSEYDPLKNYSKWRQLPSNPMYK